MHHLKIEISEIQDSNDSRKGEKMRKVSFVMAGLLMACFLMPDFVFAGNAQSLQASVSRENSYSYRVTLKVTPNTNSTGYHAMSANRRGFMIMDVYSSRDKRGYIGKRNIGHSSKNPMQGLIMGVIVPKNRLPYSRNYIWVKVMVDFGGIKNSYWEYAGSIP
jgi:hypothetical protein